MKKLLITSSIAVAALVAGSVVANGPKTVAGQSATLYGARLQTWAKLDGGGRVLEAGFTLPLAAVLAAPGSPQRSGQGVLRAADGLPLRAPE